MPDLSVVIPVYGCRGTLSELHDRLAATLTAMGVDWELVFVEDRSPDGAWEVLRELAAKDRRTHALRLSRNFGQHPAITAGLAAARGDYVVVMDCDLQDPPEEVARLYAKAQEGYDIVFGRRTRGAKSHSAVRRFGARIYFKLLNAATGNQVDPAYGTFSILARKVVDSYLRFQDRDRHYLFVLYWLGYESAAVDYVHNERAGGKSGYTARALLRHALDGVFFQTTAVLRWIVYLGFTVSGLGLAMAIFFVIAKSTGSGYPGWTSLAVFTLLIGGVILTSTGVTGLYVGRVFEQAKGRPLYVIDEEVGGDAPR